jgi:hypothetical protein
MKVRFQADADLHQMIVTALVCVDGVTSSNCNQRTGKMAQIEN